MQIPVEGLDRINVLIYLILRPFEVADYIKELL